MNANASEIARKIRNNTRTISGGFDLDEAESIIAEALAEKDKEIGWLRSCNESHMRQMEAKDKGLAEKDKEIARMREALSEIAGPVNHDATQPGDNRYQRIARAAIKAIEEGRGMRVQPIIKPGQLWQEADNRHTRVVEVLHICGDEITIITRSDTYKASRAYRPTKAKRSRFKVGQRTSHCGYFLVREPKEAQ